MDREVTGGAADKGAKPGAAVAGEQEDGRQAHKLTMAERELERIRQKSEQGDAIDPLALDDPTGKSVERVVLRAGIVIVAVLIVGILLAQVSCRSMRLSSLPTFTTGTTTEEDVSTALSRGVLWGGQIVAMPTDTELVSLEGGQVTIAVTDTSSRSLSQVIANVQASVLALAMNVFEDGDITQLTCVVQAHADADTGAFTGEGGDPVGEVLTITYTRSADDPASISCTIEGYDPTAPRMTSSGQVMGSA